MNLSVDTEEKLSISSCDLTGRGSGNPVVNVPSARVLCTRADGWKERTHTHRGCQAGLLPAQPRGGKTPCRAMMKVSTRKGCMLLCGRLPPVMLKARGDICVLVAV